MSKNRSRKQIEAYNNIKKIRDHFKKIKLENDKKSFGTNYEGYYDYLESEIWMKKRQEWLKKSNNKCLFRESDKNLNIHHLHYNTLGFESEKDIMVVCQDCHKKVHYIPTKMGGF